MSVQSLNPSLGIVSEADEPSSSPHPLVLRLQQALVSCSTSIESGDIRQSEKSISELVEFLDSVTDEFVSEPKNAAYENEALKFVAEIHRFITSPSLDQAVIDGLSFELPKAAARFGCVSRRCVPIADSVIHRFVEVCNPRDMLSILCEALDSPSMMFKTPSYYAPILGGMAKVFVSIRRRPFEQVKEALPLIINVLKIMSSEIMSSEVDEVDPYYENLLSRLIDIANSIQAVAENLEGKVKEQLRALLGLYVLQIMAIVSFGIDDQNPRRLSLIKQLSHFLPYCKLSYLGLITGCDVDKITANLAEDDGDYKTDFFSYTRHGASLAVIWGYTSNEVAQAAEGDVEAVKAALLRNQTSRWQAVGMLRNVFTCFNLPWELKKQAITFLLCIVDQNASCEYSSEHADCSDYVTSLFAALQAVQMLIMHAPDAVMRKSAFDALKKVLLDIPTSERFDMLKALVSNTESSSMMAILIDFLRQMISNEKRQRISSRSEVIQTEINTNQSEEVWDAVALDLVELILKPPKGGPPSLPENSDAVLSALNLFRFILIMESSGKNKHGGVLSKKNLQKAYNEWLLPLRTVVAGIEAEIREQLGEEDSACVLNPLESVLYRCIELVEHKLKLVD